MKASRGRTYGLGCIGIALALVACGGSTTTELTHDSGTSQSKKDGGGTTGGGGGTTGGGGGTTGGGGGATGGGGGTTGGHDGGGPTDASKMLTVDAAGCPGTEPAAMAACTVADLMCVYGATTCSCFADKWECRAAAAMCPTTMPMAGSACTAAGGGMFGGGAACTYGTTDCACTNDMWACSSCPATTPTTGTACTVAGEVCGPDGGVCRCERAGGMGGGGGGDEWRCGTGMGTGATCPTTQPATGTTCTAGESCAYPVDGGTMVTCGCVDLKFACN